MTTRNAGGNIGEPATRSRWFHRREALISFGMVLFDVAFNLYYLYPEVASGIVSGNDSVFHLLMVEMAAEAITQGRDFTDPWQASMGMGYPLFHYYHHLPHVTIALIHVLTLEMIPLVDMLNWATYLLRSFFPLSIFWAMRRLGFDHMPAAMGGLVAPLVTTTGILGFGFASYVFQGWGVHAQLWAMVLLPPALALGYRVIQEGRGYTLGDLASSGDDDVPPDVRVHGVHYPRRSDAYPTRAGTQPQVSGRLHVAPVVSAGYPRSVGPVGNLLFSGPHFPRPDISEQQRFPRYGPIRLLRAFGGASGCGQRKSFRLQPLPFPDHLAGSWLCGLFIPMERDPVPDARSDICLLADPLFRQGDLGTLHRCSAHEPVPPHASVHRRGSSGRHTAHGRGPSRALVMGLFPKEGLVSRRRIGVDRIGIAAGIYREAFLLG